MDIPQAKEKDSCCERCYDDLLEVMEANLMARAEQRALALEREARKRAMDIITEAREEAARLKQKAEDEGFREGCQGGLNAGQEKARQMIEEAQMLLVRAQEEKERLLGEVEPQALQLAFAVARHILRREVVGSPEAVAELLKAAAKKIPDGEAVLIEVAPGEAPVWTKAGTLLQEAMDDRQFQIAESAKVPPGEFMLSSEVGTVDARLEPQLEVCRTHLLGEDAYAVPGS